MEPSTDDLEFTRDRNFKRFREEFQSVLVNFERAQEWADLIRYLQQLQKTLTRHSSMPIIPDKVLVAKRLYQCLNPALPSGVHERTLETIELIFGRIGPDRLARDLAFYSEGIFPLYRHASYQVKPIDVEPRSFKAAANAAVTQWNDTAAREAAQATPGLANACADAGVALTAELDDAVLDVLADDCAGLCEHIGDVAGERAAPRATP